MRNKAYRYRKSSMPKWLRVRFSIAPSWIDPPKFDPNTPVLCPYCKIYKKNYWEYERHLKIFHTDLQGNFMP